MLEKLIANTDQIAVFFYGKKDKGSYEDILDGLENIDDELDTFELPFVKISSKTIAADFGYEDLPVIVFFQKGVPSLCDVDLMEEAKVLKWILIEADLWVEPPVVEQIFLIESTRQEVDRLFSIDKHFLGTMLTLLFTVSFVPPSVIIVSLLGAYHSSEHLFAGGAIN